MTDIKFELTDIETPATANPFAPLITSAIEADRDAVVIVPEGMKSSYAKVQIQKAARQAGRTARFVKSLEGETKDGYRLAFKLADKIERNAKDSATVEEDAASDAPAEG